MQGCVAVVWLGMVGIDTILISDIEFHPFENSSVLVPQERQHLARVTSIGVIPFVGDPPMAEWWAAVLQQLTELRVVSPSNVNRQEHLNANTAVPNRLTDQQIRVAQQISAEYQVDCVLIGDVAGQEPQSHFAGLKMSSSRRLYLYLLSAEGSLMWKTELPFTVSKGAKDLNEERMTRALLDHVRAHASEVGLADLPARNQGTASRSSSWEANAPAL
jgi:hypothetical protein